MYFSIEVPLPGLAPCLFIIESLVTPNYVVGPRFTTTTTTIILRLFALICARVIQHVFPKPSIPALFVFDHTPLGVYLLYLPRVVGAAPKTGRGEGKEEGRARRKGVGEGREEGRGRGEEEGGRTGSA